VTTTGEDGIAAAMSAAVVAVADARVGVGGARTRNGATEHSGGGNVGHSNFSVLFVLSM